MTLLDASGNLGFLEVSQKPSQAPSGFLGRSAPHARLLPTCHPCVAHGPSQLHLHGEDTHLSKKSSVNMVVEIGGSGEVVHPDVRSGQERLNLL